MSAGLKKKVKGEFVDVGGVAKDPLFRGEWAADSLAKQFGFASGIPADFTEQHSQNGVAPEATNVPALGFSGSPSAFTGAVKLRVLNMNNVDYSQLSLDLSKLGIENISRVSAWVAQKGQSGNPQDYYRQEIRVNGVLAAHSGTGVYAWKQISASATSADVVSFRQQGTYGANINGWGVPAGLTGIEIFNRAEPYMLGEFVTYNRQMYKSLVDYNGDTPGTSVKWELALVLPPSRGTTAERPAANTAGAGFYYYDTTLGKPIWSNGTAWTDAAGTPV